jgi:hypothetical protein
MAGLTGLAANPARWFSRANKSVRLNCVSGCRNLVSKKALCASGTTGCQAGVRRALFRHLLTAHLPSAERHSRRECSHFPLVLSGLPLATRVSSSVQILLDRRAFCQAQEPPKCFRWTSSLEEANGKHLPQHRRCQAAILQTSPITETMKKLREPILGESCPLFRKKQGGR